MVLDLTALENNTAKEFSLHENGSNPQSRKVTNFGQIVHKTFGDEFFLSMGPLFPSGSLIKNYDQYADLVAAIRKCNVLESFTLDLDSLSIENAEKLAEALMSCPNLSKIIIRINKWGYSAEKLDTSLSVFITGLAGHRTLKEFYIDSSPVPRDDNNYITKYASASRQDYSNDFKKIISALLTILQNNRTLEILKVSMRMGNDNARSLVEVLQHNKRLKFLDLSSNDLDDIILPDVVKALTTSNLRELNLRNNYLTANGAKVFIPLIKAFQSFIGLYIFDLMHDEPEKWISTATEINDLIQRNRKSNSTFSPSLQYVTETMVKSQNDLSIDKSMHSQFVPIRNYLSQTLQAKIDNVESYAGNEVIMHRVINCLNTAVQSAKGFTKGKKYDPKEVNFSFTLEYRSTFSEDSYYLKIKSNDNPSVSVHIPHELSKIKMERNQHTFTAYDWIQEEKKQIFLLITRMLSLQLKFKLEEKSDIAKVENYWMMAGDDYVWGPSFEQLLKEKRTSTDSNNDYLDLPPVTSSSVQDLPLTGPLAVQSPQTFPMQVNFSPAYYGAEELSTVTPMDATSTLIYAAPPSMTQVNATPISSSYYNPPLVASTDTAATNSLYSEITALHPLDNSQAQRAKFFPPQPPPPDFLGADQEITREKPHGKTTSSIIKTNPSLSMEVSAATPGTQLTQEQQKFLIHLQATYPTLLSHAEKLKLEARLQTDLDLIETHPSVFRFYMELANLISAAYFSAKAIYNGQLQVVSDDMLYWSLEQITSMASSATSAILPVSIFFMSVNKGVTYLKEQEVKLKAKYLAGLVTEHKKEKLLIELPLSLALILAEEISQQDIHAKSQFRLNIAAQLPDVAREKFKPKTELDEFIQKFAHAIANGWCLAGKIYNDFLFESTSSTGTLDKAQRWQSEWLDHVLKILLELNDKPDGKKLLELKLEKGRQWLNKLKSSAEILPIEVVYPAVTSKSNDPVEVRLKNLENELAAIKIERKKNPPATDADIAVEVGGNRMLLFAKSEERLQSSNGKSSSNVYTEQRLQQLEQYLALVAEALNVTLPVQQMVDDNQRKELLSPGANGRKSPNLC